MSKNEHLIVIPLEPLKTGEQFIEWPLHITIVPWFGVEESRAQELDDLLLEIASRHLPIEAKVGRVAMFGAHHDISVNLIQPNPALDVLHQDVFDSLEKCGFAIHQKEWLDENYKPHIAWQGGKHCAEGQEMQIAKFALIKQTRQKVTGTMVKELAKEYQLGENAA